MHIPPSISTAGRVSKGNMSTHIKELEEEVLDYSTDLVEGSKDKDRRRTEHRSKSRRHHNNSN